MTTGKCHSSATQASKTALSRGSSSSTVRRAVTAGWQRCHPLLERSKLPRRSHVGCCAVISRCNPSCHPANLAPDHCSDAAALRWEGLRAESAERLTGTVAGALRATGLRNDERQVQRCCGQDMVSQAPQSGCAMRRRHAASFAAVHAGSRIANPRPARGNEVSDPSQATLPALVL